MKKIKKIYKPLARLIKKKERVKSVKLKMKLQLTPQEIPRVIKDYYEHCMPIKPTHGRSSKFLERYSLPRMNQEETENINRSVTNMEIKSVINIFQQTEA